MDFPFCHHQPPCVKSVRIVVAAVCFTNTVEPQPSEVLSLPLFGVSCTETLMTVTQRTVRIILIPGPRHVDIHQGTCQWPTCLRLAAEAVYPGRSTRQSWTQLHRERGAGHPDGCGSTWYENQSLAKADAPKPGGSTRACGHTSSPVPGASQQGLGSRDSCCAVAE